MMAVLLLGVESAQGIRTTSRWFSGLVAAILLILAAPTSAEEIESAIARGGRLYDKWSKVIGVKPPKVAHKAYPENGQFRGKEGADWRCKECHGWDYLGNKGAYGKGKHFTGIKGVIAMNGDDPEKIIAVLKSQAHGFEMFNDKDLRDLALFISKGQLDMDRYIDRATKQAKGDKAKGEIVFNTICANCHGLDGTLDEDGKPLPKDGEPLGLVATDNPWEALHKIRNGQPGERMPALRAFDVQVAVDVLAYMQTLPTSVVAQK